MKEKIVLRGFTLQLTVPLEDQTTDNQELLNKGTKEDKDTDEV